MKYPKYPKGVKRINKGYKDYIKAKLCQVPRCRYKYSESSDPHHTITRGLGGAKTDDYRCVALCRRHHNELHSLGVNGFESLYGLSFDDLCYENLVEYIQHLEVQVEQQECIFTTITDTTETEVETKR